MRGKKFKVAEELIGDLLGGLDSGESALVKYRNGFYIVEFETKQVFDNFTIPKAAQVELIE